MPQQPTVPVDLSDSELTGEMFENYCQLVNWALNLRLNPPQRTELKAILNGYYARKDRKQIAQVLSRLREFDDLAKTPADKRTSMAWLNLGSNLKKISAEAKQGSAEARWLHQTYYVAHPIYLASDPPLTRDVANAWMALDEYIRRTLFQKVPLPRRDYSPRPAQEKTPSRAAREQTMIVRWKKLTSEERYKMIVLPYEVDQIKRTYPTLTPRKQQEIRFACLEYLLDDLK